MHVLIRSALPSAALVRKNGSARNGRAIETRSEWPADSTCSAISGVLIRFVATSGTDTAPLSLAVTQLNPPRGTEVAIVGIRASCQPIPVLMMLTPAASSPSASPTTSPHSLPSLTRSSIDSRNMIMKSSPVAARTRSTISRARRERLWNEPPEAPI